MTRKVWRLGKTSKVREKLVDFLAARHAIEDYSDAVAVDNATLCQIVSNELQGSASARARKLAEKIILQLSEEGVIKIGKRTRSKNKFLLSQKAYKNWLMNLDQDSYGPDMKLRDPNDVNFFRYLESCMEPSQPVAGKQGEEDKILKNLVVSMNEFNKSFTLIDFGCGDGRLLHALAKKRSDLLARMYYVGLDIDQEILKKWEKSPEKIQILQRLNSYSLSAPSDFLVNHIEGEIADFIFLVNVIHEISPIELSNVLIALLRQLKVGGQLFIHEMSVLPVGEIGFSCWTAPDIEIVLANLPGFATTCSGYRTRTTKTPCINVKLRKNTRFQSNDNLAGNINQMVYRIYRSLKIRQSALRYDLNLMEKNCMKHLTRHFAFLLAQSRNINMELNKFEGGYPTHCPVCLEPNLMFIGSFDRGHYFIACDRCKYDSGGIGIFEDADIA